MYVAEASRLDIVNNNSFLLHILESNLYLFSSQQNPPSRLFSPPMHRPCCCWHPVGDEHKFETFSFSSPEAQFLGFLHLSLAEGIRGMMTSNRPLNNVTPIGIFLFIEIKHCRYNIWVWIYVLYIASAIIVLNWVCTLRFVTYTCTHWNIEIKNSTETETETVYVPGV